MGACFAKQPAGGNGGGEDGKLPPYQPQTEDKDDGLKLLLLGAGESGKTTLFKRMLLEHGRGYTEEERIEFAESIYENTIESMRSLIFQSNRLGEENGCQMLPENEIAATMILDLEESAMVTEEVAVSIKALWQDPGIRNTYDKRSSFQIPDSACYFFDNIDVQTVTPYIPSEMDVLRCRDRTTGIHEDNLAIDGHAFKVFDVGGQRAERKRWVKVFQGVKAILFVVAISEFDQICFEDDETNRLEEALEVFDKVCNSGHFQEVLMVVLFNKTDLFREKIASTEFKFRGYEGPQGDYDEISSFILQTFRDQNKTGRDIVTKFTCAIADDFDLSDVFSQVISHYSYDQ